MTDPPKHWIDNLFVRAVILMVLAIGTGLSMATGSWIAAALFFFGVIAFVSTWSSPRDW
jgi:hypothetical protein